MAPGSGSVVSTIDLMGLPFARVTREDVVDHVFRALKRGDGGWIATLNLDYMRRCAADPDTRQLLSDPDLVVADGMPLLWAARLQGTPLIERVARSDLVWLLARRFTKPPGSGTGYSGGRHRCRIDKSAHWGLTAEST